MRTAKNFRWVAHAPTRSVAPPAPPRIGPTPSYSEMPRWGLVDAPRRDIEPAPTTADSLSALAPTLLIACAVAFVSAAAAEVARYVVLLVGRTTLIPPMVLALSDAAELCLSVLAGLLGLVAVVACVFRLRDARSEAYETANSTDPRRLRTLMLGTLVPGVNLVLPGVFLSEINRVAPKYGLDKAVKSWWAAWVVNWVLLALLLLWRQQDGVQALANGVVFTAVTDVAAAAVAVLALLVVRRLENRELRGRTRTLTRWTVAVPTSSDEAAPASRELPSGEDAASDQEKVVS